MRIPVILIIIKITLVRADSHNDNNTTSSPKPHNEKTESTVSSANITETTLIFQATNPVTASPTPLSKIIAITSSPTTSIKPPKTSISANSSSSLTLSSTTPSFTTYDIDDLNLTKILIKKGHDLRNHADKSIKIATPADGDFLTLIRHSSIWVDKSLLIRKIWDGIWTCHVVVTAPAKWGKTINLSMFKFHCELPLDSNGMEIPKNKSASHLYFNEGKVISENGTIEELIEPPLLSGYKEHLANYPVIHMSGFNLDMDNALESLRTLIHQTYRQHENLLNRLNIAYSKAKTRQKPAISQNITQFREFYEPDTIRQLNDTYLLRGIQILSKLLFDTYKRKVIVLFDDYDQYAHKAYFSGTNRSSSIDNEITFVNIWEVFLRDTFKLNRHLEKAILTGVLKAHDPGSLPNFPDFYNAYIFDDEDLFPYYGFFDKEVERLASERGLDQHIDNITEWYGGYRTLSNLGYQMFSPYSIAQFMNTLQIRDYWPISSLSGFVNRLLEKPEFQQRIRGMVETFAKKKNQVSSVLYNSFKGLELNDYAEMRKIDLDQVKYYGLHEDTVFSFLVSNGYVGLFELNRGQVNVLIKIPNREIYNQISNIINS